MKGNYHFEDADRRESNIKLNYEKDRRRVWIGLTWIKIGTFGGPCEYGNKIRVSWREGKGRFLHDLGTVRFYRWSYLDSPLEDMSVQFTFGCFLQQYCSDRSLGLCHSQGQGQGYITTNNQSVSMSWYRAQSRTIDQSLLSPWNFF
jgi:hypothetical protein